MQDSLWALASFPGRRKEAICSRMRKIFPYGRLLFGLYMNVEHSDVTCTQGQRP